MAAAVPRLRLLTLATLLAVLPTAASTLPDPFAAWLEEVDPLITETERTAFAGLAADYQRRAFIEQFWRVRDPFPETARNELREDWEKRAAEARQRWSSLADPRARIFLINGEPADVAPSRCGTMLYPLEIWHYRGSAAIRGELYVVFLRRPGPGGSPYRLWNPADGLSTLVAGAGAALDDAALLASISRECIQGDRLATALAASVDWQRLEEQRGVFPDPGDEWVQTFQTYGTDLPEGAAPLAAELSLGFPGVRGGRTVVQGVVSVARQEARPAPEGGDSYDFVLDGEVLRRDELFERFRYRFRLPAGDLAGDTVPLLFQRYLRPGVYRLVVRAEELSSGRYFRHEIDLKVPFVEQREGRRTAAAATRPAEAADGAATAPGFEPGGDPAAEANRTLGRGDAVVRLLPPPQGLQVDNTRVEAVVEGEAVARVRFELNGKPVLTKGRPPYSVDLALGEAPRSHEVTAVALAADGEELARDRMLVNGGPHRFAVRLVEPQPGRRYASSLRAAAEVDVPEGDLLERVEFFRDEQPVATLYQPPFAQPILLPGDGSTTYVRAVAHLVGGAYCEDVVLVNAPDEVDRVDVHFVELYTSVLDRRGRPVEGLDSGDFTVREDGVEQQVRRFELVRELPIYAGLLLDTSSSMVEELDEALLAAHRFFETVITPRDRAAVITFNHAPELAVRFTADPEVLAGGLSGVGAVGGTALYDSLIYALYYFSGVQGKRALILISDGEDQGSRYRFEEALDYARRTGVAIYTIGLGTGGSKPMVRNHMLRLASETGGQSFFVHRALELAKVYRSIEDELRTQYLLAYQSSHGGDGDGFRQVAVEVARPGVQAKTIRGYYP